MSRKRQELQKALLQYTTDTLTDINTVSGFCEGISAWKDARKKDLSKLMDIKDRADKVDLSFSHVTKSKSKCKALWEYIKNTVTSEYDDSRREELETELADVLEVTLTGLEELDRFQEAVEKLAVTSFHVFMEENQVLHLPGGISLEHVQVVITAARLICPLLLAFKRDARVFFLPKLRIVEELSHQLDKYIKTTQKICEDLEKSQRLLMTTKHLADLNLSDDDIQRIVCHINQRFELRLHFQRTATETVVDLDVDLSEDEIQRMLDHINQLDEMRMDQNFRLVFLFQDVSCSGFIDEFNKQQPRMQQFLTDLEKAAVQLDKMNKGAKISSVAGSSVGAVGGVLSIIGLALIPVTAGVSGGLTIGGTVLAGLSALNTIVTTIIDVIVNCKQKEKVREGVQSFMKDVQSPQGFLKVEEVSNKQITKMETSEMEVLAEIRKVIINGHVIRKCFDLLVDAVAEEVIVSAGRVVAQKGKARFIAANALFLGVDVFFICKDSYGLSKGRKTEVSQIIRARAALWSSEMDSWKKIHDSLCEGQKTSDEHRAVLDETFYPRRQIESREKKMKYPSDQVDENEIKVCVYH